MLPLLVLPKMMAYGMLKYIPLPIFDTLREHEVTITEKLPNGRVITRTVKLRPTLKELRADWRRALGDSLRAAWHRHFAIRFFTNVCETVVLIVLIPRGLYGMLRRKTSLAYWMLHVPQVAEHTQYRRIHNATGIKIIRESAGWIWHSIKVWSDKEANPSIQVHRMRKNPNWLVVLCCGRAYAVRRKAHASRRFGRRQILFSLPNKTHQLRIQFNSSGKMVGQILTRTGKEVGSPVWLDGRDLPEEREENASS